MEPPLMGLISLLVLILLNAVFSIVLQAMIVTPRQPLQEKANAGDRNARTVLELAQDPAQILGTFRIINIIIRFLTTGVFAIVFYPIIVTALSDQILRLGLQADIVVFVVIFPLVALIIYILTDIVPEAVVQINPSLWARSTARIAKLLTAVLRPLVNLMGSIRRLLVGTENNALVTEEEIMTLIDVGEEEGSIEQQERDMIYSIFQLDTTMAREIMVPRIDVIALSIDATLEEARDLIIKAGHSRIPVFEETLDNVKGLLYAKDLLEIWHNGDRQTDLITLLRAPLFIPESKSASELLRELQNAQVHMAVVIDEYGGTAGLVTIEDIVEEIVGEIVDEYDDEEESLVQQINDNEYILDGRLDLDDLNRLLNRRLSKDLGDTLGGFIFGQLGRVPDEGDTLETDQLRFKIVSVEDRRIRKVRVEVIHPDEKTDIQLKDEAEGSDEQSVNN